MPEVINRYLASFDEIHRGTIVYTEAILAAEKLTKEEKHEAICDFILDYLIDSYLLGLETGREFFGFEAERDMDAMRRVIEKKIDGKTFRDRVSDHLEEKSPGLMANLADSEFHRVFNEAEMEAAMQFEKLTGRTMYKTWRTVGDNRVRDTHDYIDGVKKELHQKFRTFDDDEASAPGGFNKAENNAGCRCWLVISASEKT